jgi:hypothetical protein
MSPNCSSAAWITSYMVEVRCCRFHQWFVLLLVLAAWSLVSHFFVDMLPLLDEHGNAVTVQQKTIQRNQGVGHATDLHGGYLLSEVRDCAAPTPGPSIEEISVSSKRGWIPPAPFRPPIPTL